MQGVIRTAIRGVGQGRDTSTAPGSLSRWRSRRRARTAQRAPTDPPPAGGNRWVEHPPPRRQEPRGRAAPSRSRSRGPCCWAGSLATLQALSLPTLITSRGTGVGFTPSGPRQAQLPRLASETLCADAQSDPSLLISGLAHPLSLPVSPAGRDRSRSRSRFGKSLDYYLRRRSTSSSTATRYGSSGATTGDPGDGARGSLDGCGAAEPSG